MNLKNPHISNIRWPTLLLLLLVMSCGGGGSDGTDDSTNDNTNTTEPVAVPTLEFSVEENAKNPITDLSACATQVLDCMKQGTVLGGCFGTQVTLCQSSIPQGGCCMQACGDQLSQLLAQGKSEQQAYLEVFIRDGSCMPGVAEWGGS